MKPTRFVKPQPVPNESYEDRMARIIKLLRALHQAEAIAFIHEMARMIVQRDGELNDAYAEKAGA